MKRILERIWDLKAWGLEMIQRLIVAVAPVCVREELDSDRKQALPLPHCCEENFIPDHLAEKLLGAFVFQNACQLSSASGHLSEHRFPPLLFRRGFRPRLSGPGSA